MFIVVVLKICQKVLRSPASFCKTLFSILVRMVSGNKMEGKDRSAKVVMEVSQVGVTLAISNSNSETERKLWDIFWRERYLWKSLAILFVSCRFRIMHAHTHLRYRLPASPHEKLTMNRKRTISCAIRDNFYTKKIRANATVVAPCTSFVVSLHIHSYTSTHKREESGNLHQQRKKIKQSAKLKSKEEQKLKKNKIEKLL